MSVIHKPRSNVECRSYFSQSPSITFPVAKQRRLLDYITKLYRYTSLFRRILHDTTTQHAYTQNRTKTEISAIYLMTVRSWCTDFRTGGGSYFQVRERSGFFGTDSDPQRCPSLPTIGSLGSAGQDVACCRVCRNVTSIDISALLMPLLILRLIRADNYDHVTLGARAFATAGSRACNSLPEFITSHLQEISQDLFI